MRNRETQIRIIPLYIKRDERGEILERERFLYFAEKKIYIRRAEYSHIRAKSLSAAEHSSCDGTSWGYDLYKCPGRINIPIYIYIQRGCLNCFPGLLLTSPKTRHSPVYRNSTAAEIYKSRVKLLRSSALIVFRDKWAFQRKQYSKSFFLGMLWWEGRAIISLLRILFGSFNYK